VVEVPLDIHDTAALSTSPLVPSPVSPISKVNLAFKIDTLFYNNDNDNDNNNLTCKAPYGRKFRGTAWQTGLVQQCN